MSDSTRPLAERAAELYVGRSAELRSLGQRESAAYRVDADGERFALHLHDPRHAPFDPTFLEPAALESECTWMAALARETALTVPDPVRGPDGAYVVEVDGFPCTLLRWVEGETIDGPRTTEQASRLGGVLAALHEHAERWERPAGFVRPTLDRRWTREAVRRLEGYASTGVFAGEVVERFAEALDVVERELTPLADEPGHSGLIHADLHEDNYVFHEGEARPIDFGRCGFGPWLYDVAECSMHLYPERRRELVEAYSRLRPFGDGDLRRLEGYLISAAIESFGHNASNEAGHEGLARSLASVADKHVRRYLAGEPFMFEM